MYDVDNLRIRRFLDHRLHKIFQIYALFIYKKVKYKKCELVWYYYNNNKIQLLVIKAIHYDNTFIRRITCYLVKKVPDNLFVVYSSNKTYSDIEKPVISYFFLSVE